MTDDARFGRLDAVDLTSAWAHEARDFTPWLATNLDRLSEALGFSLELEGQEVAVGSFSADILARDLTTGTRMLIENQFQQSDHTHLGQILTYLAGLQARTVVWIAPRFRDEHLSAIRWLNEHTEESFSFFAVALRVVRIGTSPMVPMFDVIERPNTWNRQVQSATRDGREIGELGQFRREFWHHCELRLGQSVSGYAAPAKWRMLRDQRARVSQFIGPERVGVYIGTEFGGDPQNLLSRLVSSSSTLEERLGAPMNPDKPMELFIKRLAVDMRNRANWDRAADWLKAEADRYEAALKDVLGGKD